MDIAGSFRLQKRNELIMLDPVDAWTAAFASLPLVGDVSWASNLADKVDSLVTGKLQINEISPPSSFTFQKAIFESQLQPILPVLPPVGAIAFAAAWGAAMQASTMVVGAGASVGAPGPATTFSAPPATLLLPASIASAQAVLAAAIIAAPPVPDAFASTIAASMRTAFTSVLASVTGTNSVTPTPGPLVLPAGTLG